MAGHSFLGPGRLHVDDGPVQMYVSAQRYGRPLTKELKRVEAKVHDLLTALSRVLPDAKRPWPELSDTKDLPRVLEMMIEAVTLTADTNMTPMAAVAGAFADIVADYLVERGATKVIVNNGGDIALRLKKGESARVGISPRVGAKPTYAINVTADGRIGGIATSGLGGRSFTLGIADSAVILAERAATADACATHIANCTNTDSVAVTRCPARQIDPNTDIPDLLVTTKVEQLQGDEVEEALDNGLSRAKQMVREGLIRGAIIFVQSRMKMWPEDIVLQPIRWTE